MLKIEDVSKHFGGVWALKECSLETRDYPAVGLIGPNGSGKTTLFHTITGFYTPDTGSIYFEGEEIQSLPTHRIVRKGIGRTFQISRIFESLSLMDNLLIARKKVSGEKVLPLFTKWRAIREEEIQARDEALSLLELMGLEKMKDTPAGNLSYGQRKLLELARTLMLNPSLILLDEPAAGINPTLIRKILTVIHALKKKGKRFFIIEHNMDVIIQLCEWVFVLDAGTVIAAGTPDIIRNDPKVLEAYFGK